MAGPEPAELRVSQKTAGSNELAVVNSLMGTIRKAGILAEDCPIHLVKKSLFEAVTRISAGNYACNGQFLFAELQEHGLLKPELSEADFLAALPAWANQPSAPKGKEPPTTQLAFAPYPLGFASITVQPQAVVLQDIAGIFNSREHDFPTLFNHLLGNLYFSHGCVHVSPSDSYLLAQVFPAGGKKVVKPQNEVPNKGMLEKIPLLSSVAHEKGLDTVAAELSDPNSVSFDFYPSQEANVMLIMKDGKPYAKVSICAGPPIAHTGYIGDINGEPMYDKFTADPTDPGTFTLATVTDHVLSERYEGTNLPEGAQFTLTNDGWIWQNTDGSDNVLSPLMANDLDLLSLNPPPNYRTFITLDKAGNPGYLFKAVEGTSLKGLPMRPLPKSVLERLSLYYGKDAAVFLKGCALSLDHGSSTWLLQDGNTPIEQQGLLASNYNYSDMEWSKEGILVRAKWGSNDFSKWALIFNFAGGGQSPEYLHSSPTLENEVDELAEVAATIMHSGWADGSISHVMFTYSKAHAFVADPRLPTNPYYSAFYKISHGISLTPAEEKELKRNPLQAAAFKLVTKYLKPKSEGGGKWNLSILTPEERQALIRAKALNAGHANSKNLNISLSATNQKRVAGIYFSLLTRATYIEKYSGRFETLFAQRKVLEGIGDELRSKLFALGLNRKTDPGGITSSRIIKELILLKLNYIEITPAIVQEVLAKHGITIQPDPIAAGTAIPNQG